MELLWWVLEICGSLYLTILLVKFFLSLHVIGRDRFPGRSQNPEKASQITILQAILGGDPHLPDVLRTTLENTSDETSLLWMVDTDDAQGLAITEKLGARYPHRVAIIRCETAPDNVNPKVFKLEKALAKINTPYMAVLDDDTMISDQNLTAAIEALGQADLYTGLPGYLSTENRWDSLVAHFVNNNSIMTYLPTLPLVGPLSINGMFYVLRTGRFLELGGFSSIRKKLCDDYALARKMHDGQGRIHQGIVPQYLYTSISGFTHYLQMMHRWFVFANALVRDQRLGAQLILLVLHGSPPLLLWACLVSTTGLLWSTMRSAQCSSAAVVTAAMGMALVLRHGLIRSLQRKIFDRRLKFTPITSVVSEVLQPLHWLHAVMKPTIKWRTRQIRVYKDNTFTQKQG